MRELTGSPRANLSALVSSIFSDEGDGAPQTKDEAIMKRIATKNKLKRGILALSRVRPAILTSNLR